MPHDIHIKIQPGLFELLITGKEVIIEQPDGSKISFVIEGMSWQQMALAIMSAQKSH